MMNYFTFRTPFYYYRQSSPNGNFNLKITPEQLIFRFSDAIEIVFPKFSSLPHKFKLNFAKRVIKFLNQYPLVEKGNVVLTNQHKVSIAASYIKLTLGFSTFLINSFNTIIVYPTAQFFPHLNETHTGHFNPKMKTIMLALDEFEKDIYINTDGKDVALHEFTHALCFEMLQTGAKHPNADRFQSGFNRVIEWFENLENKSKVSQSNFLRVYAFTNRLELISVLIELFFEKEYEFRAQFPQLYLFIGYMINHPKTKALVR